MQGRFQLLTEAKAGLLVDALLKIRGENKEISLSMNGAWAVCYTTLNWCRYDAQQGTVLCELGRGRPLAFKVSSPAIAKLGVPNLTDVVPPPGLGIGEHETRWSSTGPNFLQVVSSQVIQGGDRGRHAVWTDVRGFSRGRERDSVPLSTDIEVQMFRRECPRP